MHAFRHRYRLLTSAVLVAACSLAQPSLDAQKTKSGVPSNPDDKTIIHVLNRIGFGPGPGDVARVREMGLATYIERQLYPQKIDNPQLAPRLASLETLGTSTRELAQEYFCLRRWRDATRCAGARNRIPRWNPPNRNVPRCEVRNRSRPSVARVRC